MNKNTDKSFKASDVSRKLSSRKKFGYFSIILGVIGVIVITVISTLMFRNNISDNYDILGDSTISAPMNLRVENKTILRWDTVTGANGYYVYELVDGTYNLIASTTSTSKGIITQKIENNTNITKYYRVKSFKKVIYNSSYSIKTSQDFSNTAYIIWENTNGVIGAL